jgi:hypothetical protein
MESIIMIKGKVNFQITLDPGVWIFDDRKVDLTTYFTKVQQETDELEEYTKSVSKHWDREIMEGAIVPPTLKTERTYKKQKLLNGTFRISLKPFLENAEIQEDASTVQFVTVNEIIPLTLDEAKEVIVGFSLKGKPLGEEIGGPIHVYYGDGSNATDPIKNVKEILIK